MLSQITVPYNTMVGGGHNSYSRHNVFFHALMERGTPINVIRLIDEKEDTYYDLEVVGGSAGNPQIYIGAGADSNNFINGNVNNNSVSSYALQNYGTYTYLNNFAGTGWSGVPWIRNESAGRLKLVNHALSYGTVSDAGFGANYIECDDTFNPRGSYGLTIGGFTFTGFGSDGVYGGVPILWANVGSIVPLTTGTGVLGNSFHKWSNLWANYVNADVLQNTGEIFANLPAPAPGQVCYLTDGGAGKALGDTITVGGGSTKYLIWYNGTNWTVIGK